jgi:hypothetical protein
MSYDSPDFKVQLMSPPIWATFAAVIATTTTKLATSANSEDRIEFFRNIRVKGFRFLPKTGITQGQTAAHEAYSIRLYAGSDIIATAPLLGTADAGVMAYGVLVASNVTKIGSNEEVQLKLRITPGGTATTATAMSGYGYMLYENSFA